VIRPLTPQTPDEAREAAITKATRIAREQGETALALCRTDHPYVNGDYFYAIRLADKHAWTPGERVLVLALA